MKRTGRQADKHMTLKSEIEDQFKRVAQEQGRRLAPLKDDSPLAESGLDSLCFAVVVSRLETSLGLDPFTESEDARFPTTFGEFVSFYENAHA
jgi:acyl carrier protein